MGTNSKNDTNKDENSQNNAYYLSNQITDRSEKFKSTSPIIPEGDEEPQKFVFDNENAQNEKNQDPSIEITKSANKNKFNLPPSIQETDEMKSIDITQLKNIIIDKRSNNNNNKLSAMDNTPSIDSYS